MLRRLLVFLLLWLLAGGVGAPGARAGEEVVFRGFQAELDDTVNTYALSLTSRAMLDGELVNLPALTAEFRVAVHAPDEQGHRLAELTYTKLQVEPDSGEANKALEAILNKPLRLVVDQEGNLVGLKTPELFSRSGFDVRNMVGGPLPKEWEKKELRVGERVVIPLQSATMVDGVDMVTEGETALEYLGREERDGALQDVLLLTTETTAGPVSGNSRYEIKASGRLYIDLASRAMTSMVMETVVTPPLDAPNLPTVATTTILRLLSSEPLTE